MKCAIDCETTGLVAGYNEIISIAIVPLNDDFSINTDIKPFVTDVRPEMPDHAHPKALEVNGRTLEELNEAPLRSDTISAFNDWFTEHVAPNKIQPLGQNFAGFDKAFIQHWLDPKHEAPKVLDLFFHYQTRDSQFVAMFMYDRAKAQNSPFPFNRVSLTALAKAFDIDPGNSHSAYDDAVTSAKVYKAMVELI